MNFDWIYTKGEPIKILLRNFSFYHQTTGVKTDPKYILEKEPNQQLYNWLKYNKADSASYLITGHRGAGKSSLVNYTIKQLMAEKTFWQWGKKKKYVHVSVSLGQEFLEEIEILRILARNLQEEFKKCAPLYIRLFRFTIAFLSVIRNLILFVALLLIGIDSYNNIAGHYQWPVLLGEQVIDVLQLCLFIAKIFIVVFLLKYVVKVLYYATPYQRKYRNIHALCTRLNATITDEEESSLKVKLEKWMTAIGISNRKKKVSPPASIQEIEFELIKILEMFRQENLQLIIVFDELDKVDTNLRDMVEKNDSINPDFQKLSVRPEQHVSSRVRTQQVLKIVANMKYFLSTAKAYFLFIAGRELFEAFQADMCDRDFSISSIFNGVLNVESFLNGKSGIFNNTAIRTEEFVCRQLLPPNFEKMVKHSAIYSQNMIFSLKNYYIFRLEEIIEKEDKVERKQQECICQELQFLYHFVNYLAFISNGSPKKITLFFEKYVRSKDYLENVEKINFISDMISNGKDSKSIFYLSWGFRKIQKVNFVHYLTYPLIQGLLNRNSHSGDKLLISSSFLITYILKLHNNGFSWRNLEQTPELQELNKTPEMRDYLNTFINFMNHNLVTTVPCGLYHYKFPMKVIEEISYHSRLSGEMSTLFNFSSTDLQGIKNQYMELLKQNAIPENKIGNSQYTLASILHSLGDLYVLEENYSAAIRSYEQCLEFILPIFEESIYSKMIQSENYLVFANRTMLKLGLAHEKRGTSNSAFILYDELIGLLKQMCANSQYHSFFNNIRTAHLSILAKLFILEKIDTNGITSDHLMKAIDDFKEIMGKVSKGVSNEYKHSKIIQTDFYRKLGDILYYKNSAYENQGKKINALNCYLKSIKILCEENREQSFSDLGCAVQGMIKWVFDLKSTPKEDESENKTKLLRDNEIYHLALSFESIGNVCLFSEVQKDVSAENLSAFCDNYGTFLDSNTYLENFTLSNHFEKAILCYWSAAHLYSLSCERGLSVKCYKNVVYTLLLYARDVMRKRDEKLDSEELDGERLLELMEKLIRNYLICLHRQKEHIHLPEINYIQWLHTLEMYQLIPFESLSITPETEEILFLYQSARLELWRNGMIKESGEQIEKLVAFYQSPVMTGKDAYQTMFSSTLLLKLKARFNLTFLYILLDIKDEADEKWDFEQICFGKIKKYHDKGIEDSSKKEIIKKIFKLEGAIDGDGRMDLLDALVIDSIYCLARIQEQIIPVQNSMVFNNSFKADVFYNQFRVAIIYQYLYCYYTFADAKKQAIVSFLQQINGINGIHLLKELPNGCERGKKLYSQIRKFTHYNNQNCTNALHLGESCIHYYTKAKQVHMQGKTYQEFIKNIYFLEDDLNNDCTPFNMAIERWELCTGRIQSRESKLKKVLSQAWVYDCTKYYPLESKIDKANLDDMSV